MAIQRKQLLLLGVLFITLIGRNMAQERTQSAVNDNGTLTVIVTWGDINNTPANDVYIEAYTSSPKHGTQSSYILKQVRPGDYEFSLPPGVYDVFMSEGNSIPRCKRVMIQPKYKSYWTVKLEDDDVFLSK